MTKYIKYLRSNFDVSMGGDMVEKLVVEGIEKHVAMEEEENRYLLSRLGGEGHEQGLWSYWCGGSMHYRVEL